MKKLYVVSILFFLIVFVSFGKKKLIDVVLIKNNGDTVFVQTKASYYEEVSFNSFGYYNENGSRGRAHAGEYKKINIKDKYLESVALKSTVKKECDKRVFLERLIDGPMIMYLFQYRKEMGFTTKCIEEIYIRKKDEECAYPIYKDLCSGEIALITQPKNKEDILRLFGDAPEIIDKIEQEIYHRYDFEEMVLEYNRLLDNK